MHNSISRENDHISVSIIIPVFNKVEYTKKCVSSLINTDCGLKREIIIVDNGSRDGTEEYSKTLPSDFLYIKQSVNSGFAKACNVGARAARGEYLVFLNNDTVALPKWLEEMIKTVEEEKNVGVVGSRLLYPNGTIQHAGILIAESSDPLFALHAFYRMPGDLPEANALRDYQAVTGACLLIKKDLFFKVNGFSEDYINGYEDIDLCFKVRQKGYRVVYCPKSVLYHYESVSEGRYDNVRHNVALLHKRWLGKITPDIRQDRKIASEQREPVSIVIVTGNSIKTINECIDALLRTTIHGDEIIIVDNNSDDGTREYLSWLKIRKPMINIIFNNTHIGSRAYKKGVLHSSRKYVALIKPEVLVTNSWLSALQHFKCDHIEAVGPMMRECCSSPADYARKITIEQEGTVGSGDGKTVETTLDASCIILPRWIVNELDLFNTDDPKDSYELELSRKLQAKGYTLMKVTDAVVCAKAPAPRPNSCPQQNTIPVNVQETGKLKPGKALTSIVIPCLNQMEFTRKCVDSIYNYTAEPFELIFINNGSTDITGEYLNFLAGKNANATVITNKKNLGYGAACNQGISAASGRYILLLNNDTLVTEEWLTRMLAAGNRYKDVGVIGPRSNEVSGLQRIINIPYRSETEMRQFARHRSAAYAGRGFETSRLVGFCMLLKKEVIDRIGGLDLRFGMGNFEDDDICLRARIAGYKLWVCDDVFIHHYGSVTFKGARLGHARLMKENWSKFREKWDIPGNLSFESGYDIASIISRRFDTKLHYCPLGFSEQDEKTALPI